jgi:hypothetical protein
VSGVSETQCQSALCERCFRDSARARSVSSASETLPARALRAVLQRHSAREPYLATQWHLYVVLCAANCRIGWNHLFSSFISKNIKIKVYRNIILPVLCGCGTWSLTLREEDGLEVFQIRVLSKIFGPKREEVTGE